MKLANLNDKPVIVLGNDRVIDVPAASEGRFTTTQEILGSWEEFRTWADAGAGGAEPVAAGGTFGPAVPRPRQIFGVGFNYPAHAGEAAALAGEHGGEALPLIFTKFPTSVTGPDSPVELPDGTTDFEVELVVVIGRTADRVPVDAAWSHVAGLMVGQDISSRGVQFLGPEQHTIGKSFRTFSPLGPYLVTPDALPDADDLELRCWVNDEPRQKSSSAEMGLGVAELIALLSAVTTLEPGDLIFTGTPEGVGGVEKPPRYLAVGDVIRSEIEGLGSMANVCVAATPAPDLGIRWHAQAGRAS